METNEILAVNVKKYRQRCDLSQEEFANTIGLSPSHLREIEHARGNPTLDTLDRIAKGLEVTPEALLFSGLGEMAEDKQALICFLTSEINHFLKIPVSKRLFIVRLFEYLLVALSYNDEE